MMAQPSEYPAPEIAPQDRPAEGAVALVTGSGAPRVGNAIARRLAAAGFRLVIHANASRAEAEATAADLRSRGTEAVAL